MPAWYSESLKSRIPRIQIGLWQLRHVSLVAGFALALAVMACGNDTEGLPTATSANTSTPVSTTPKPTLAATLAVQVAPSTLSPGATSTPSPVDEVPIKTDDGISMGGAALGGNAETTLLGQAILSEVPNGNLAWIAYEATLEDGQSIEHDHESAFVYAVEGRHRLELRENARSLASGEGGVDSAGAIHSHVASQGPSVFWEVRLADPASHPPAGFPNSTLIFESDVLEGIPASPMATFVLVRVPVGGETSVHTHPGPELIYQITGKIEYQNALIGTKMMGPGAVEGIPPLTGVQKRNPYNEDAEFLSWFLVDTSHPFAFPASFSTSTALGDQSENLASSAQGAKIVGVSSNYAGGANDSSFGANKALDGNPATAWSSDGDGDDAWLEIEFPSETAVTSLGLWSRSMGTTAEIVSFRVVSGNGDVTGPFILESAGQIFYFDAEITGKRLRFEALETRGGNTGVVEIEVYGSRLP